MNIRTAVTAVGTETGGRCTICISLWHVGADPLISNCGGRGQPPSCSDAAAPLAASTVASDASARTRIRRAIIGAHGDRCEADGRRPGIGQEDGRSAGVLRSGHERYAARSTRGNESIANCLHAHGLELVANENAVFLLPAYAIHDSPPGVIILHLANAEVTWKILVMWRRGRAGGALKALLNALFTKLTPKANET